MRYIVIGNGVAGTTAVDILAKEAPPDSIITQITNENFPYYWRPKLPSLLENDEITLNGVIQYDIEWYKKKNINLHLNESVTKLIPEKKVIETSLDQYPYDRLLIAIGADCYCPPVPGLNLKNSYTFRSLTDALEIRKKLNNSKSVVIIGGGILGIESAVAISSRGIDVTVIEYYPYLLPRQLDKEGGEILQSLLEKKGIQFKMKAVVEEIYGDIKVEGVKLRGEIDLPADLVLSCTGIAPRVAIPREAGISVNKGVIVNDYMETSIKDVYAAGDIAEHKGHIYGLIPPSVSQAKVAAQNMIHPKSNIYSGSKISATLKVADLYVTSFGDIGQQTGKAFEEKRYINSTEANYVKLYISENRIHGAIILGTKKGVPIIRRLTMQNEPLSSHKEELNQLFPNLI